MKLYSRVPIVDCADMEIGRELSKIIERFDLTYLEIQNILIHRLAHYNKYALRSERHPEDPDKGADEL